MSSCLATRDDTTFPFSLIRFQYLHNLMSSIVFPEYVLKRPSSSNKEEIIANFICISLIVDSSSRKARYFLSKKLFLQESIESHRLFLKAADLKSRVDDKISEWPGI
ncbi:hypothetical protein CEXT_498941 [Caerostris extrusa]|uniref:Maturase K n=1 Tax=Caerostris extrusa TaxID=172846 RepID=A0AAV4Y0F0_CAEEX|nr:hypothetical protein CEXT_498941 [Caerostris extrusa]